MPPKPPPIAEGFGQLSITGSLITPRGHRESAGVWGLIGPAAEVDPLKAQGPSATAAVVAYSTGAANDAVYAESMLHAGVTAVGHTDSVPAIQATHDGTTGGATAILGTSTAGGGRRISMARWPIRRRSPSAYICSGSASARTSPPG